MAKVATKKRGSHTPQNGDKKRKTRIHITLDEEVGEVLDKLYIRKSKFLNDLLRIILFGEGDVMSFLESLWWARGDLNPGSPPCEGSLNALNDCWAPYKEEFEEWLSSRIAKSTTKDYMSALERFFGRHTIKDIKHLRDAINKENYNEKIVKGLRNFINFLVEEEVIDEGVATLLKRPLKLKKSTPRQVFITTTELKEAYQELTAHYGEESEVLLKLLVYTGLRLKHIVEMLNTYDPQKLVIVNEKVARYPMMEHGKGTKKAFWAYMPRDFAEKLQRKEITYYQAQRHRTTYNRVSASTIRKWFSNFMAQRKVSMEVIDFIQGRAPRSVLERHYLNLTVLADEAYSRVVNELKGVLCEEGGEDASS